MIYEFVLYMIYMIIMSHHCTDNLTLAAFLLVRMLAAAVGKWMASPVWWFDVLTSVNRQVWLLRLRVESFFSGAKQQAVIVPLQYCLISVELFLLQWIVWFHYFQDIFNRLDHVIRFMLTLAPQDEVGAYGTDPSSCEDHAESAQNAAFVHQTTCLNNVQHVENVSFEVSVSNMSASSHQWPCLFGFKQQTWIRDAHGCQAHVEEALSALSRKVNDEAKQSKFGWVLQHVAVWNYVYTTFCMCI